MRQLPFARDLERPALLDQIPDLLERIADLANDLGCGVRPPMLIDLAEVHALERLDEGCELVEVVMEFGLLRDCIVRAWSMAAGPDRDPAEECALHQAIDAALASSVQRYTLARDRTLQSLDRISAAALETNSLDEFLARLLGVLLETTAAVDSASILLREGDTLRVRGYAGANGEDTMHLAFEIAQHGEPIEVEYAYGVPLIDSGEVIGVAHMRSLTARHFSKQDQRLFVAMANRATSAIRMHLLREAAERRARQQHAVSALGMRALAEPDLQALFSSIVSTVAETLAVEGASIVEEASATVRAGVGSEIVGNERTLSVPIVLPGERRYGVLEVHTPRPDAFCADDISFLQSVAQTTALAIALRHAKSERAHMLEQQDSARAEAQRALAVLDMVLSSSSLGIGFIDTELRYVRVNSALAALNGVPADEHAGRSVREVLPREAADFIEPLLYQVLETRQPIENLELDAELPTHPGDVRSFIVNYVPVVTAGGELLGIGAVVIDVTERRRILNELREREEWFRSLADNIPQLAWMADETGAIIWYNRRWYEYTGTTIDEMKGWGWQTVHHPEHVERVIDKFRRHVVTGEVWEDTFPLRGADGRYRWFLSRAVPIVNSSGRVIRWFGTNTDVTEQRMMNEAMAILSSSRDYHETLKHVARLTATAIADWCVIDVVEAGKLARVAIAPDDEDFAQRLPMDCIARVVESGVSDAGDSYVIAPLIARNRTLGAITCGSAGDVAEVEELGRRVGLAVDNAQLFAQIQREAHMREEILAIVSHDLKNPLGALHLAATMLLAKAEGPTRRHLELIERSATRMDHLIGDLLDLSSIQSGHLAIVRKPEELDTLVREVYEAHGPIAREQGLELRQSGGLPPVSASVDRDRLLQVFGNLIGNAIKFCRPGDIITLGAELGPDEIVFSVADTGPGISAAEQPHIFEPYWSAKRYAKKGTGLGLYISKGIIEAHGGRIWLASTPGEGATFYFTIPLA